MTAPLLAPCGAVEMAEAPAVLTPGSPPTSYADLAGRSHALAGALTAAGLTRGDRVATLAGNGVDQVVLFFACAEAGLVLVPLSWRAAPGELAGMLAAAEPALLATDAGHADAARRACAGIARPPALVRLGPAGLEREVPEVAQVPGVGAPGSTVPEPVASSRACRGEGRPGEPVLLLFTSGSSGRPKGVLLSQAACHATSEAFGSRFPLDATDTVLVVLPQFHVAAWNVQPLLAWSRGARVVIAPGFDPGATLATIEQERVTAMMGVPTVYEMLAVHPDFARRDLSGLRTAVVGGAPVDPSLGRAWADRGVRIQAGYGLTEAGPNVLCEPADAGPGDGWMTPYDGVEVRLHDSGQLLVRGPGLFSGYWRDPAATAAVLRGGWLATGDLAERSPDGRFRLRGRSSEKYISGGENVHPVEVERALRLLPAVSEAAVVGVPDPRWGEAGVAFVVATPGDPPAPEALRADVRAHLAGFKVPREVVVVDALPLTGTGKVDKRALRQRATGEGDAR